MRAFYALAALWATLALCGPSASFAGPGGEPEKTVPQGQDPPGAENGQQHSPPTEDKEVIPHLRLAMKRSIPKPQTRRLVMKRRSSPQMRQAKRRASRLTSRRP
jgi:hypothetical protein